MPDQEKAENTDALGSRAECEVRRDLPFLGMLSPEKTEAIIRGERVEITAEESGMFRAQMKLKHDGERERFRRALERLTARAEGMMQDQCWGREDWWPEVVEAREALSA